MGSAADRMGVKGDVGGSLLPIYGTCYLKIPLPSGGSGGRREFRTIYFRSLPEVTDKKSASYNSQTIFGRSSPIRSYSDSGPRTIEISFDLYNVDDRIRRENFSYLRAIASAVHPQYGAEMYGPPPICRLACGAILSGSDPEGGSRGNKPPPELDCLLTDYSFSYGKESVFDDAMFPFHISVDLTLEVIYSSQNLPGQEDVLQGRF